MAQFTNQAQLTYGNVVTNSNVAVGEILEALSITKTAVRDFYSFGDSVAYVINIINSSSTPLSGLSVSDDLGTYTIGSTSVTPLEYIDGSAKYFIDGVLQPSVSVNVGTDLVFSQISVPANGNTAIVYEASVNQFAPLDPTGEITNTATLSGAGITPIQAIETISASVAPNVSITKSISPVPVSPNGVVTYTFSLENTGNTELTEVDNAVITDTFDPVLSNISVSFNGVEWAEGTNYTYNEATGEFATIPGQIVIGAGSYVQDPVTGVWTLTPATANLTVTGNIGTV